MLKPEQESSPTYVGLQNLGNTCYMNSALQALFMTQKFRAEVLKSKVTVQQPILLNLHILFSTLCCGRKKTVSPVEFHQSCRPSYFEFGRQHDSSEYLSFLLNGLQDEESTKVLIADVKNAIADVCTNNTPAEGQILGCSSDDVSKTGADEKECGDVDKRDGRGMKRKATENCLSKYNGLYTAEEKKARSLCILSDVDIVPCGDVTPLPDSAERIVGDSTGDRNSSVQEEKTLIDKLFGGILRRNFRCIRCSFESEIEERFFSLVLPVSKSNKQDENGKDNNRSKNNNDKYKLVPGVGSNKLNVQYLLSMSLEPELLIGENQYYCKQCKKKCDAKMSEEIVKTPEHLILILSRFEYDKISNTKRKLLTEVEIPETLTLPKSNVTTHSENARDLPDVCLNTYTLYAVVVHSGSNTDDGHYYTIARLPKCTPIQDQKAAKKDKWFIFNDSHVEFADFKTKCPRDGAYVLFYFKIDEGAETECSDIQDLPPEIRKFFESEGTGTLPQK